ncbi:MAG: hypothetical protein R3F15_21900 [Lysobacterales bacterium]
MSDKAQDFSLLVELARASADGKSADAQELLRMVSGRGNKELGEALLGQSDRPDQIIGVKFIRRAAGLS